MTRETVSFNPLSSSEQEQFNAASSDWPEMARFGKVRHFLSKNLFSFCQNEIRIPYQEKKLKPNNKTLF